MTLRTVSYGGGVQSTALLVLAAQKKVDFNIFLFSNVGDDSEHPKTLEFVADVAVPFAAEHGIELHELRRFRRDGSFVSLWERLTDDASRSLPIPVRMSNGAPGTRSCTASYKIEVIAKWLKQHGATADDPATVAIGISVDEMERANSRKHSNPWERIVYPLLELGLNRHDCMRIIEGAGLPVPPKSSCFFCPMHRMATWMDMARDEPDLFEKSCALEDLLNERRDKLGKDHVFLTRRAMPLRTAVGGAIQQTFDFDGEQHVEDCDSGHCFL